MRKIVLAAVAASALCGMTSSSMAEDVTVIHRETAPSVSVERRDEVVERREVTTGSVDCGSKTVRKEDADGNSVTVHKEGCR